MDDPPDAESSPNGHRRSERCRRRQNKSIISTALSIIITASILQQRTKQQMATSYNPWMHYVYTHYPWLSSLSLSVSLSIIVYWKIINKTTITIIARIQQQQQQHQQHTENSNNTLKHSGRLGTHVVIYEWRTGTPKTIWAVFELLARKRHLLNRKKGRVWV